ncbi:MAG: T9SS type A sorting domain-containing protein [Bacteroidales bacterium]|nr:T9SS type A sorting domain-containing protein [Bacteroidales bacterium]MCF8402746.1 T9SS type A sorting domain-containing protein [Bacteroidales bacterium]
MKKKLLLVLVITALAPYTIYADWVPLSNKAAQTPPEVTILSEDNSNTVIKIDLAGFNVKEISAAGKTYQTVDLLSEMMTIEQGYPELSYIAKVLAIPDRSSVSVEVLETSGIQIFENIYLPPARESWFEGSPETPYVESGAAYSSDAVYPKNFARVDPPSIFRDFRIARVSVFPLRYVASKKELHAVSSITVRVNYGSGEVINPKTAPRKKIAPSFGKIYRSFIFNYQNVLDNLYGGKEEGHDVMLCIMPDEYAASFEIYADWKHKSGTYIHITKFSDIGANSSNPDIIKNHISDAYYNWPEPPTYVLMVGDDGVFPKKMVTYGYTFPNEDFFVEIEGNDYIPEMMIGRLTNQNDYRLQVLINKFMLYEQTPYTAETSWFKKGICCSNNAYASQIETKRYAAACMLEDGGFISVDTLMSDGWGSSCSMNTSDVLNAITEGRSFLNYRGEGWSTGWWAACYDINTNTITSINNAEKFTFVTSIGCGVAMFNTSGGNCFGEEWLEMGSLTEPRGCIGFVGPTSNTHTTYNNKIDKGIYTGMFWEGMDTPGQALLRGKLYMYNVFGPVYYVEYHYRIYCILGDPSLHIWKDIPLAVNVAHDPTIYVGNNQVEFIATFASNGEPVANAELCLAGNDIYLVDSTNAEGKITFNISPNEEETLSVTLRGGNVIPYQGTIEVLELAELVELEGEPFIVDLDGNLDGLMNPNENCNITFTLKNWGNLTASNIQATLTLANTDFAEMVTTSPVSYGNLTPGSSFTGDPFQFYVKPDCPVGQIIPFQLSITSTTTAWEYTVEPEVMGCRLMYDNFVVFDEGIQMDFRMDPGETVRMVFAIENMGEDVAPDAMGILTTNDPYITIEDGTGSFGTLNIDDISKNFTDYFKLSVDAACPTNYWAEFSLNLYTQNGNYPYQTNLTINLPVAMPVTTDYTGPDEYGYYSYASNDAFYEPTPVYEWVEIEGIGTEIMVPLVSDYTETVSLPFTFKYYGYEHTFLRISTDGWIALNGGGQIAPVNTPLPNNDNVNNMAAVFWDDLYDIAYPGEGSIYYYYDNPNNRFIVEWDSISHNDTLNEPKREVFQAILLDPAYYPTLTGDGEIIFQYKKVMLPESITIGIEDHSQDIGLQYLYNEEYDPTAGNLIHSLAIKFTTQPPFTDLLTDVDADQNLGLTSAEICLEQNYPNPFYASTRISFTLPEQDHALLNIYNAKGQLVRNLYNGWQGKGSHTVEWDGLNEAGNPAKSGVYFYRLQTENVVETRKMFMLR